jgi:hypothetical protein
LKMIALALLAVLTCSAALSESSFAKHVKKGVRAQASQQFLVYHRGPKTPQEFDPFHMTHMSGPTQMIGPRHRWGF